VAYHKEECLSLDLLQCVGVAHLAVRLVLSAGIQTTLETLNKHNNLTDPKNVSLFAKGGSGYERVYSLLDHLNDMHPEDIFQYTLVNKSDIEPIN
jgi:hypothetical protein